MGCVVKKSKSQGSQEIYCSIHKKQFAESLCVFPQCSFCQKDAFALCIECVDKHKNKMNENKEIIFIQNLQNFNLEKLNYYRYQVQDVNHPILTHLKTLEDLMTQWKNSQIRVIEYLKQIYDPLQELIKFSQKLREIERENDHDMLNNLNLYIGTIKGDGTILDEVHSIKHLFNEQENTIRNALKIVIGYFFDTGTITDKLYKKIGYVEMNENGASVLDERKFVIGRISQEGVISDKMQRVLGSCKANKLKVAYEYFFF